MNIDQYDGMYPKMKALRDAKRAAGVCINGGPGPRATVKHGPVVRGGKCERCIEIHKGSR